MNRRAWARGGLSAAVVVGLLGSPAVLAGPAVAEEPVPAETVFQSDRYVPRETVPIGAGASGVLYRQEGRAGYLWSGWDGGTRTVDLGGIALDPGYGGSTRSWLPAGTDVFLHSVAGQWTREDFGTGARVTFALPQGHTVVARAGDSALTRTGAAGSYAFQLFEVGADGTATETAGVPLPAGATLYQQVAADAGTLVVVYKDPEGVTRLGLIDLKTGAFTKGPVSGDIRSTQIALTPDRIAWVTYSTRRVRWAPRTDPSATPKVLPVKPVGDERPVIGAAGDDLLLTWYDLNDPNDMVDLSGYRLQRISFEGAAPVEVLRHAGPAIVTNGAGEAVVTGGTDSSHWALRTVPGGGKPVTAVTAVEPVAAKVTDLSLANGLLATREVDASFMDSYQTRPVTRDGAAFKPGERAWKSWTIGDAAHSGPYATGDGRVERLRPDNSGAVLGSPDRQDDAGFFRTASKTAELVDLTGRYAILNGADPARQYVGDIGVHHDLGPIRTGPVTAASVWGSTYWTQTGTAGRLSGEDLRTGATTTLDTGAPCVAEELQAVGRWLYWSCGTDAPAGVWDRTARKNIDVPSGEALVGDGYLVRHDKTAGELLLTAFRDGSTVTRAIGDLAGTAADQRGVTWTVDKFGGPAAYVDADRRIHLVPSGVPTEPFAVVQSTVKSGERVSYGTTWTPRWLTSRPAGSWTVTLRDKSTGAVARTLTGTGGGPSGGAVSVSWDGKDDRGLGLADGAYTWTLDVLPADGPGAALRESGVVELRDSAVTVPEGTFAPLTPTRALDTRSGLGAPKAKVGAGETVTLPLAGVAGLPATGVTAVVLNVTATNPSGPGYVSVHASGLKRPYTSSLNFAAGQTVANAVVVPVVDGKVSFYSNSGTVDLVADVSGYFARGEDGSVYTPAGPARLMDTRSGLGVPKDEVGAGETVTLQVAGRGGVPQTGVTAVVLNVTATAPTRSSFVTVFPAGTSRPTASSLNFTAGRTVPNLVTVPVVDGKVSFYNHSGTVDLLADVAGYYSEDASAGSAFTGVSSVRVLDTRYAVPYSIRLTSSGSSVSLRMAGAPGIPPEGVTAVVLNVTATRPTETSFVSVYPTGGDRPSVSNLNFAAGQTVSNLVVVPVVDGEITFYNHLGSVELIADVAGYYGG
ncbi:hypothetical protein OG393_12940 [Streptomyces sp. NBC_01216]|uniref:FlgD immunoglobulin-like domain containing protein n=1 Tax=Streptomyces sp. NBC_01216 TaxID=2903778 RepID=UPI002E138830|nr:hypothetical protein OG393_12940 [Streptomyces sp. NBC_01216]